MSCCVQNIRETDRPTEIGDVLGCRSCGDNVYVGEDGAWHLAGPGHPAYGRHPPDPAH